MSTRTLAYMSLLLLLAGSSSVMGQPAATIGPIPEMQKYPGLELWMVNQRQIEFARAGWWLGGYDNTMMVKWGDKQVKVKDLTEQQRTYLWDLMSPEQRRQMSDEYGKIGFGMGGHLKQRPEEWGPLLNARIAEYFRGVDGWDEVAKRRHEAKIPPEVPTFLKEKDDFLQANGQKLTGAQIAQIQEGADGVEKLGSLIATIELKKVEVAVKGLSAGLLGIITDYLTGFATHGAHYVSDAVATVISKMIDIGRGAADKSPSPGEQIQIMNKQVALAKTEMLAEMDRQRAMWKAMLGEEPTLGNPELSIVFVVDCSGSMSGSKIAEARASVKQAVANGNDGKTEWAIVGFGSCQAKVLCRFSMDADKLQAAADRLRDGGDTPLTYGISEATTYLVTQGKGRQGRLVILADGEDNCRERGSKGPAEASGGFRPMFTQQRNISMPNPAPAAPGGVK